ncbi:MAG: hypothetical protein L0177_15500, partial [Chloroflexi bacterium]|nr:hypothetical protein [Chloroflexota bacterium]
MNEFLSRDGLPLFLLRLDVCLEDLLWDLGDLLAAMSGDFREPGVFQGFGFRLRPTGGTKFVGAPALRLLQRRRQLADAPYGAQLDLGEPSFHLHAIFTRHLCRLSKALAKCYRVDEYKEWADKAEALASYGRQTEDDTLLNFAKRIKGRAVR